MDWDDCSLQQCLWDVLCSFEHCWTLVTVHGWTCSDASQTCIALLLSSKTFLKNVAVLRREMHRPWLCDVDVSHTTRMLTIELATRRMIRSLTTIVPWVSQGTTTVACAGGFASWQLERCIETANERDAFPRTFNESGIGNVASGVAYMPLWIPGDIDVFVETEDTDLVYAMFTNIFRQFIHDMFSCDCGDIQEEHAGSYWRPGDGEEDFGSVIRTVELLLKDVLPSHWVSAWVSQDMKEVPTAVELQSTSFSSNHNEPMAPCVLNLVFVKEFDMETFDFEHCKVLLHVTPEGRYTFGCSRNTLSCLQERRLACTTKFVQAKRHVQRLVKYVKRGFSIPGTPFTTPRSMKHVNLRLQE